MRVREARSSRGTGPADAQELSTGGIEEASRKTRRRQSELTLCQPISPRWNGVTSRKNRPIRAAAAHDAKT
jgi:hypothetical protein